MSSNTGGKSGRGAEWAREYLREHPALYPRFRETALGLIRRGHRRVSAKSVVELLRLQTGLRLDNSLTPALARAFLEEFPQFAPLLETRPSRLGPAPPGGRAR